METLEQRIEKLEKKIEKHEIIINHYVGLIKLIDRIGEKIK